MNLIRKKCSPILMLIRWFIYIFNKTIIIYYIILSLLRRSYLMKDILLGWKEIKKLIREKKKIFNYFCRSNNNKKLLDRLKDFQTQLNFLIEKSKGKYYWQITSRLSDIGKNSKTYWSILKSFYIIKKFQVIESNEYITDFKKKSDLFNSILQTSALNQQ